MRPIQPIAGMKSIPSPAQGCDLKPSDMIGAMRLECAVFRRVWTAASTRANGKRRNTVHSKRFASIVPDAFIHTLLQRRRGAE
jgi:hypothetical protein